MAPPAPAPVVFNVAPVLPKLYAAPASEAASMGGWDPSDGVVPKINSRDYIAGLLQEQRPVTAVRFLACALPEREAVRWAAESTDLIAARQTAEDKAATEASRRWLSAPGPESQAAAAAAAVDANRAGPGAWAAQAAAWAAPKPALPAGPAVPPAPSLVPKAVAGSVMMSAALAKPGLVLPPPAVPEDLDKVPGPVTPAVPAVTEGREVCLLYRPFIEKGLALAEGTA